MPGVRAVDLLGRETHTNRDDNLEKSGPRQIKMKRLYAHQPYSGPREDPRIKSNQPIARSTKSRLPRFTAVHDGVCRSKLADHFSKFRWANTGKPSCEG